MSGPSDKGIFWTVSYGAGLRVAQVVALTASAGYCGKVTSQSFSTTPALLEAPAPLLAKQWKKLYDSDGSYYPAFVLPVSAVFGYLAYREPRFTSTPSLLYTTSATLFALCVPYTYLIGEPITRRLEEKAVSLASVSVTDTAAEVGVAKEDSVHQLVDRWATMNLGRAVLSGVAALLATWAAVDRLEVTAFQIVSA